MPSAPPPDLSTVPASISAAPVLAADRNDGTAPSVSSPGRSAQDLAAGLLFAASGLGALWLGRDWPIGTLAAVQSGFFPRMLGVLLVLFGIATAGRGLLAAGPGLAAWAWRPLIAVTAAVLAFAAVLESLGLVAAVLLLVGLGNLAGQPLRPMPLLALGSALAFGCIVLFVQGLGLPLQVWPPQVMP